MAVCALRADGASPGAAVREVQMRVPRSISHTSPRRVDPPLRPPKRTSRLRRGSRISLARPRPEGVDCGRGVHRSVVRVDIAFTGARTIATAMVARATMIGTYVRKRGVADNAGPQR